MPTYTVDMGGRAVTIETSEPFSIEEQQQAAAIKLKSMPVPPKDMGDVAIDIGKGAILPTIGQLGGAAGGAMLGGPPGALMGGTLGGAAGEGLNQLLGLTDPSAQAIGMAGAGQGVASVLSKGVQVAKQGVRNLPGVAQFERGRILRGAESAVSGATPEQAAVDTAFVAARASAAGAAPPSMAPLIAEVQKVAGQIPRGGPMSRAYETTEEAITKLSDMLTDPTTRMTDVVNRMDDLGRLVRQASGDRTDTPQLRALYAAMRGSIEEAAASGQPPSRDLLQALQLARQRHAALQLDEIVKKAMTTEAGLPGGAAPQQFYRNYRAIREDLVSALPPEAIAALDHVAARAQLAPRGSTVGIASLILGGSGGAYFGGPGGMAAGALGGAAVAGLPAAIRETLSPVTTGLLGAAYQASRAHTQQQFRSGAPVSVPGLLSFPR